VSGIETAESSRSQEAIETGSARVWTERLYALLPLPPWAVGVSLAVLLTGLFAAIELGLGRHRLLDDPDQSLRDPRLAIMFCLFLAYLPTAYVYLIRGSRRAIAALGPLLAASARERAELEARVGRYGFRRPAAASLSVVAFTVYATFRTTPPPYHPYDVSLWTPEVAWHRVVTPIFAWWLGRLIYAVLAESGRLSRLAERLASIDLLDPRPLAPFARQALLTALLVVAAASILSLLMLEDNFVEIVLSGWIVIVLAAGASALLPLRGVHRVIRAAKQSELDWCDAALRRAREAWSQGRASPGPAGVHELAAYRELIADVREWPLDTTSLIRFIVFVLLPLGSWAAAALVERAIDSLLGG
jgi:hypothetical protein